MNTDLHRLRKRKNWLLVLLAAAICIGYYLFFFVHRANFRAVVAQKVYRSAQPSPSQLKNWVSQHQIRTVINLRGDAGKATDAEQAMADELGVKMITIRLASSSLPSAGALAELFETLETAEQPILIHCRAGVDRTGMASALAAMAIGKADYETAKWQAYVPPGPWKRKRTNNYVHISDIFKFYESYCRRNGLNTNGWQQFKRWAIDDKLDTGLALPQVTQIYTDKKTLKNSVTCGRANQCESVSKDTNSYTVKVLAESNSKYKFTCSYFPQFNKNKRFFPIAGLVRGAYIPFAVELVILSLLAAVVYRRLCKAEHRASRLI